jgi:hypothetical protein
MIKINVAVLLLCILEYSVRYVTKIGILMPILKCASPFGDEVAKGENLSYFFLK